MVSDFFAVGDEHHLKLAGFEDLPAGWEIRRIGDLLSDDRGISVGVMYPGDHDPIGVPLIKAGDLTGSRITPQPDFRISREKHHEYRRTEFSGGEILMTLVGNVGQCAIVPPAMAGWNAARAIAVIRLRDPSDAAYVRLCLLSRPIQHLMEVWSNTTVQQTLNLKEIRLLPLPWPKRRDRDAIAECAGALDDKIELNRRMNETLEGMARAHFKSWFVDFDPVRAKLDGHPPPGLDASTAALFPDHFEHTESGEVPRGWRAAPLTNAIEVNPSRALKKGESAPYLDMGNMPTRAARALEVFDREFGSGMRFVNGDTLVARITPCLENGKTCFVDFLREGQVGWGSTEYIVLRPKPPLSPEFAYFLARTDDFRAFVISNMTGTSGRQRCPADCLIHFAVVVPSPSVAERFGRIASAILAQMKSHDNESRTLAALRDNLLPKLLSGELKP
jgi:type I restriction enzyme, S subunit